MNYSFHLVANSNNNNKKKDNALTMSRTVPVRAWTKSILAWYIKWSPSRLKCEGFSSVISPIVTITSPVHAISSFNINVNININQMNIAYFNPTLYLSHLSNLIYLLIEYYSITWSSVGEMVPFSRVCESSSTLPSFAHVHRQQLPL